MKIFEGRVAVVTGAANGIGRALVERLARAGALVQAWDLDGGSLEKLVDWSSRHGLSLHAEPVDVTRAGDLVSARDRALARHGRIDLWFNNAGLGGLGGFLETPALAVDRVVAVNLGGVLNGTRHALEAMERQGAGTIVNMASVAGFVPGPYLATYCATKHGVVGFTRALREELRLKDSPVRLCLVSPGFVDTALVARGSHQGFPEYLSPFLAKADSVAAEVLAGIRRGRLEIFPTYNGRLMLGMHRLSPRAAARSARLFLVRGLKDLLLNRYTVD